MYDCLTVWFYASKGIWVDFSRKWKLALLQNKWWFIIKLGGSFVYLRRPIRVRPQRLQIKVCTTKWSEVVPSSLDSFIKFALSFLDKWMSYHEPTKQLHTYMLATCAYKMGWWYLFQLHSIPHFGRWALLRILVVGLLHHTHSPPQSRYCSPRALWAAGSMWHTVQQDSRPQTILKF